MRPGRAADHSPPSSAAIMEEQSYTSTHPLGHTGPVTGSLLLANINTADCSTFSIPTYTSALLGKIFVNQAVKQQSGVRVLGCHDGEVSVL